MANGRGAGADGGEERGSGGGTGGVRGVSPHSSILLLVVLLAAGVGGVDGFIVPIHLLFGSEVAGENYLVYGFILSFFILGFWMKIDIIQF